jgi:hypothetical protein
MRNYYHFFFASCLLGSLIGWQFTTKPYPTFAIPIIIIWLGWSVADQLFKLIEDEK